MAKGTRRAGEFCWINMLTPQPDEACRFFAQLLGWTYGEIPGMGYSVLAGGHHIGGLFDLEGPNTPPGTPPLIGVMVKVDSADATSEKALALGGKTMPAFDIMDAGRMAVCYDPNGANIDVWEPKKNPGTEVDSNVHGAPSWFETMTTDAGRATRFYAQLFGWTAEVRPMPNLEYTTFKLNGEYVAGLHAITPEMGNVAPHWATYFTVDDVDATAREAVNLGGTIVVPLQTVEGVGRFCGIRSPQGVMFHAITYGD
jgi:predicted enzyme related to lactoylglutathione lyase